MQNTDADSDAALLAKYRRGELEALEKLVERYRRPLFHFVLGMTGSAQDAEDIFQEVWFRAIRNMGGYRHDRFLGWLLRIARNHIIDRNRRWKRNVSLEIANENGVVLGDTIPGKSPSPAALVGNADSGRKIMEAVKALPPEQKEVFLLRVEGEMPFKEIARLQHVSINTALARMQYALAKLRKELKGEYAMVEAQT